MVDAREGDTLFIDVATFGKQAEACAEHLEKGRQVAVTGRLVPDNWTAKDGQKRSSYRVIGNVAFGSDRESGRDAG